MGKILNFVIFIFTIYAWTFGYALSTLLKTCEGENLEDCVNKAETLLQDPDMTFPDDNQTLQSVCRMWEEMTGCTYNYTARCLTLKENTEFHQYFQEPISSMKTVCTNKESTDEYFRHAHCIKKISTGEHFCATQYKIMIDQIISVTMSTMRRICCALSDFKECVMKANINHVCGNVSGGLEGASIASYALRTLEKSLLAFVAHSCAKEGYHKERCKEDEEPLNELSHLKEARWDFPFMNNSELQYTIDGIDMDVTTTKTRKPLLVPIVPTFPQGDVNSDHIRPNVSHLGERGLQIPRLGKNNFSKSTAGKIHPTQSSTSTNIYSTIIRNGSRDNATTRENVQDDQMDQSQVVIPVNSTSTSTSMIHQMDNNSNKLKNISSTSTLFQQLVPETSGDGNKSMSKNSIAEKRIDTISSSNVDKSGNKIFKEKQLTVFNSTNTNKVGSKSKNDSTISSRVNGGRSLNIIESSVQNDLDNVPPTTTINNAESSQKETLNTQSMGTTSTTSSTSTSTRLHLPNTTTITSTTITTTRNTTLPTTLTTTTATTTIATTTRKVAREPRIMNIPNGNSLTMLNQALGLAPPSTAPPASKRNDAKAKKKALLSVNNTTKAEETKNSGNFSVSDVPIRVFMVWLSTFFV